MRLKDETLDKPGGRWDMRCPVSALGLTLIRLSGNTRKKLQVDRSKLTMELARKEGAGMSLANKRGSLIVLIKRNPGKPRENHPIP